VKTAQGTENGFQHEIISSLGNSSRKLHAEPGKSARDDAGETKRRRYTGQNDDSDYQRLLHQSLTGVVIVETAQGAENRFQAYFSFFLGNCSGKFYAEPGESTRDDVGQTRRRRYARQNHDPDYQRVLHQSLTGLVIVQTAQGTENRFQHYLNPPYLNLPVRVSSSSIRVPAFGLLDHKRDLQDFQEIFGCYHMHHMLQRRRPSIPSH